MELVYIFCVIKLYIFIFTSILHFNAVACWPRHKRSSDVLNPTLTASLYDQLKKSLAPVLQQSIDLTAPPIKRIDFKALEKRFKKENKQETVPDLKAIFRDAERALKQNPHKLGRRSLSPGFIKSIIAPHLNRTVAAISDHENDYDYSDRDLPDVEEPPGHIFENNRGVSSNNEMENIAQKKIALLRYPFKKNEKLATQFGSNYEKFRQRLAPLVEKSIDLVEPTKLQDKLLEPYMPGTYKQWKNKAAHSESEQSTAYISLYDQFKRRLLDFSNELGIDVGLEDTRNSKKKNNTKSLPKVFKKRKRPKKLRLTSKNARFFHNKLKKNSVECQKQKRDNHDETLSRNNKLGPDIEFLMQQRGYIYQNHPDKPAAASTIDNVKNIDTSINSFVDGGCDYNDDILKPISVIKNHKKPFETNLRSFRNIDDSGVYKTSGNIKKNAGSLDADFFPNVFVENLQRPAGSTSTSAASSLLEIVAKKLNISTLEAAKKIAAIQDLNLTTVKNDPKLHRILQQYIKNSVVKAADQAFSQTNLKQNQKNDITMETIATTTRSPFEDCELCGFWTPNIDKPSGETQAEPALVANNITKPSENASNMVGITENQVNQILDKLFTKLREIELEKFESENSNSTSALQDAPCKISGSWFSAAMGLRFDIKFPNRTDENSKSEAQHYTLQVGVQECVPKKQHDVIDTTWPFMGSAIKELGGPFYLYTQKKSANMLATFVGYCRTCSNMDTLFGTWSFSLPAKSCLDTPASFQTKNDVMHRYALEDKRRERYKELLYKKKNLPV